MKKLILVVVISLSVIGCVYTEEEKAQRRAIEVENKFRLAWLRKAGCSEQEISQQYTPLTYQLVWDRRANSTKTIKSEHSYYSEEYASGSSSSTTKMSWDETMKSFREDLYLLPCVKVPK